MPGMTLLLICRVTKTSVCRADKYMRISIDRLVVHSNNKAPCQARIGNWASVI